MRFGLSDVMGGESASKIETDATGLIAEADRILGTADTSPAWKAELTKVMTQLGAKQQRARTLNYKQVAGLIDAAVTRLNTEAQAKEKPKQSEAELETGNTIG